MCISRGKRGTAAAATRFATFHRTIDARALPVARHVLSTASVTTVHSDIGADSQSTTYRSREQRACAHAKLGAPREVRGALRERARQHGGDKNSTRNTRRMSTQTTHDSAVQGTRGSTATNLDNALERHEN